MNKKSIWFVLLLFISVISVKSNAQSYTKLWKEVAKAQADGLPQTAIGYAEEIYRKAEAERQSGQMLKAYTVRSDCRQSVAPDSFYVDLKKLEQWATTAAAPADRAVLHTLVAKAYSDYANQNQYNLMLRSDVLDTPSDDLRQWSKNMFVQKVLGHTRDALKDDDLLFGLSTITYIPFVEQEAFSRYYNHNTYHLLASYGIHSLRNVSSLAEDSTVLKAIGGIFSDLNNKYRLQENKEAQLLLSLDGLNWRRADEGISSEAYLTQLDQLLAIYADRAISMEAYLAKATELSNRNKKAEALQVCRDAMAKFPKYERVNALKELQNQIQSPSLSARMPAVIYPGDTLSLQVYHTNLDGFTVHVYALNLPGNSPLLAQAANDKKKFASKRLSSHHFNLKRPEDYLQADTVCRLVAPQEGNYLLELVPDKAASTEQELRVLSVSRFKILSHALPNNRFEAVVFDGKSGQPVSDAIVRLFVVDKGNQVLGQTATTQADGRAEFDWNSDFRYIGVEKGEERAFPLQWIYRGGYNFFDKKTESESITLLADRSLYRPGQIVYLKGIVYNQQSDTAQVVSDKEFSVALFDANNRALYKKKLRTNAFGSFTAEFMLPSGGLNGNYSIRAGDSQTNFRVEEYKRPTFEIAFAKPEGSYKLGDTVLMNGTVKTYSGVPVQELPVKYEVTRSLFGWWGQFYRGNTTIGSGEVELNDAGEFTLPVTLVSDKEFALDYGYYTFNISATVTTVAGETQTTTTTLSAGNRSLLLNVDMPQLINKDEEINLTFNARNLNGRPVGVKGEYKLYPLAKGKADKSVGDPAYTGTFTSNESTALAAWKSLPSGEYKLVLTAKDEQGREATYEATYEAETVLFSLNDKKPARKTGLWYYGIHTDFDASQPAEFIFGTSDKDVYVLMDVFSGNKRLESRSLHLSDSLMRFTYPYKEAYGDGLCITFCYVKNGEAYTQQVELLKKMPEKELKLSWSVFRDKLRPGQEEEWKLTIQNPDSTFADAELLAILYDASLDQIWKRNQWLKVYYTRTTPFVYWDNYRIGSRYYGFEFKQKALTYPALRFDRFWMDSPDSYPHASHGIMIRGGGATRQALGENSMALKFVPPTLRSSMDMNEALPAPPESDLAPPEPTAELRTNFAETAFFYPQLRTNEKGEVVISFTMPESLTRWNFNGYAHTKGMFTGMINSEVVTSKDFMLTPNLPRFVRVGDETSVAASVANLTENAVNGNVVFTLFDPLTEKVIAVQKQKFAAEAGKTVGVNFTFTATNKYDLLGCRIIAEGGNFSDGEQHLLPVLSNKEKIIETVTLSIRGNETREFSLAELFNNNSSTATHRSLTVEFSGNPAWYAIQALPAIGLPTDDNAISWATAYYANALSAYIMKTKPRLRAIIALWKKQGETQESFLSNLQKNQELKNLLLEESPWIMEAATEQEQHQRLVTLLDLNNIRNSRISTLNKLSDLQLADGSWTWYEGMTGSRYITQYVLQQLVRLGNMTDNAMEKEAIIMRNRALGYLHNAALEEYNALRKAEQKGSKITGISGDALQYLYLMALSGAPIPANTQTAYRYFLDKVEEGVASKSIAEKAITAVILQKAGRTAEAKAYIASLKEYATYTDEEGMFFASGENSYAWSGLKVPTHVLVMEAMEMTGNHAMEVEEMKLWLLKQKRTQQWNSPVATANAVYALLYSGSNLTDDLGDVRITLGDKAIQTSPVRLTAPDVSYIKETMTDKSNLSGVKRVVVEKRDPGIAWGAIYAQYEEDIDKVTSHGDGLQIDKKLYVETVVGNKKELHPVNAATPLKVGDKVVSRLTIRLDRSMDFVQLKDQRGACFEPIGNLSGYVWNRNTGYYVAVKDASTHFFFDTLKKGVYVLEYSYRVSRAGTYESGLAVIQSAYAPEYAAHDGSIKLRIEN